MNSVPTFTATIYCGFAKGYKGHFTVTEAGMSNRLRRASEICKDICNEVGLCVTIESTKFIYVKGDEPGIKVGLINYPRFPSTPEAIKEKAIRIAKELMYYFDQMRVSVVCTDETITLENDRIVKQDCSTCKHETSSICLTCNRESYPDWEAKIDGTK